MPNFGRYCSAGYGAIDTGRTLSEDDRTVAGEPGKCGLDFAIVEVQRASLLA